LDINAIAARSGTIFGDVAAAAAAAAAIRETAKDGRVTKYAF